jgi:formate hydrogenlyase transcriptional activator
MEHRFSNLLGATLAYAMFELILPSPPPRLIIKPREGDMNDERSKSSLDEIIGDTPQLRQMLQLTMKAAGADAPVLILGEAGSGKQLIARAVHRISARRHEGFVTVNCAPLGENSLGPYIFGGGNDGKKPGQLEVANKGILFLNEIALTSLGVQSRLLRLLERREFERMGSTHTIPANVRLIASTKYDLGERVAEGTFHEDLYNQLNIFPLKVPSLRERRDDIPLLANYFVQRFARRMNKTIDSIPNGIMSVLVNSDWPGNIRQLENLIERSVVLAEDSALRIPPTLMQLQS